MEYPHAGRGRPSKYCPVHRQNNFERSASNAAKLAAESSGISATAANRLEGIAARVEARRGKSSREKQPSDAARLAIALALAGEDTPEIADAAAGVGLHGYTRRELEELRAKCKRDHPGLLQRRSAAVSELLQQFIALSVLRLRDQCDAMNPAQLALATRSAVQALNQYQGGSQAAYTNVTVTWPGKPEE